MIGWILFKSIQDPTYGLIGPEYHILSGSPLTKIWNSKAFSHAIKF